ncbi:HAMP domain-containing sensor histidine kinase [Novosphingobium sp. SL115]|uniref:sensor histidine kinase n=1 Tax=Novosphingobium sp. SL115 TaxID=2995150 RepID=UPI0022744EF0|nr:HAMP domain-containing sensor histidine kinase [Novosphingobium sp. SL115]MCY1671646.1 HAMP domain-containing sensor histidine kinase [Novosphingobium sp. SL115]
MTAAGPIHARCDGADKLVEADEMLAALQLRAGGTFPGPMALPPLLALVRRARLSGAMLAEMLTVRDDAQPVSFRAAVWPDGAGTRIEITGWRLADEAWQHDDGRAEALMRQLAEAHVVLDAEQRIISGTVDAPDLACYAAALRQGFGRYWTDMVTLRGSSHRQPLHWRLLDDAALDVPGSERPWKVRLLPLQAGGFELLLIAETVLSSPAETFPCEGGDVSPFKGLLGSNLAPALRQPLNRIVANAETIRTRLAGPLAEQYVGYAGDIAEAGRHLLGLVEDLSDLETVEDAHFAPLPDHIDLADCARRAAGILGVRAQERGIAVVVPALDLRTPAIGEFRRVLQILINLIGNAIRYTPGRTTVQVETGVDGDVSWLAVIDEGDGISPEQAEKVFEKFERLGRSGDGGSGLGLYISRKLARAMGGDLAVCNDAGGGACFVLSLPADLAASVQASA